MIVNHHKTEIFFGHGMVSIAMGSTSDGRMALLFANRDRPAVVGIHDEESNFKNPDDADVAMVFASTESVDVMIKSLTEIKKLMEEKNERS
jgi:hypothetical protein